MDNRPTTTHPFLTRSGVTLIELMIAVALIGIGVLVSVKSFTAISRAIQYSKDRTLASNIAQEKMQILMQKNYYEVLVTSAPAFLTEGSTTISYDPGYFPPETVTEGGIRFVRYTYIQPVIENSGVITPMPPTTPDTGMRQITETVLWSTDSGDKFLVVQSVLNNPNTVMANATLSGVVKDSATLAAIPNALVNAAENIGWQDTTDASGNYLINLSPGTFNFQAGAPGYFSKIIPLPIAAYSATNQSFYLIRRSSGTVTGTIWFDNHPVISQVVASTGPANGIEYVELYNPTTAPINMGTNAGYLAPNTWTVIFDAAGGIFALPLVYVSTYIPVNSFYLISNTGDGLGSPGCAPLTISGVTVSPDACWYSTGMPNHAFQCNPFIPPNGCGQANNAGGVGIGTNGGQPWTGIATTTKYDAIGWSGNGITPNSYETAFAVPSSTSGMVPGEAFVRRADTTTVITAAYGNACDSDNNSVDFIDDASPPFPPRTAATHKPPLTGTPADGAIVSVLDGLSVPSSATLTANPGNPSYAQFMVPGVATGTWSVFIDSGPLSTQIDNVTIGGALVTSVPATILSSTGSVGMIGGTVTDITNTGLNGIAVIAGAYATTTGPNGTYYVRVSTGPYSVIVNPGNANSVYASLTQQGVLVTLGNMTSGVNFSLPQGGKISGWVTRDGVNPLPGVSVVALDANWNARDNEISGSDGRFLLVNLTTGPYTVKPIMDMKEMAAPTTSFASVTVGNTVFCGTFTVTGALGTVTGSVTSAGQPIKSGVMVVIATTTISTPPPALSSNTLASTVYYADTSNENGTYSVDVRGSTTTAYTIAGFFMYMNGSLPVISTRTISNVTVTAGQTTSGVNFAW